MKLLEHYEEIVERDSSEVSYKWKVILVCTHFMCSISSYICSYLFYTFWNEVCGGHCFFWAEIELEEREINNSRNTNFLQLSLTTNNDGWTKDILVIYHFHHDCEKFHFTTLFSCIVAVNFLIMFSICGKGGYDTNLFFAPWRIVVPALICSSVMMILTIYQAQAFTHGFLHFAENLYQLAYQVTQTHRNPFKYNQICEAFQTFTRIYNIYNYNSCEIFTMIEYSVWTMTWSWIGTFLVLCLRILTSADFNLLKVNIYEMPNDGLARKTILQKIHEGGLGNESDIVRPKKSVRIRQKKV